MSTLQEAINAIKFIKMLPKKHIGLADELLGKYKGILPKGKNSFEFIRQLRESLYGKIK